MKVYHYTSIDTLNKILTNKSFRFTNLNDLNDKSEYKYGISLLKSKTQEYENKHNIKNRINPDMFDWFLFDGDLYSTSFTENGDDLNFWNSYYIEKNNSLSIGIDKDRLFNGELSINKCKYGDPYPEMDSETYNWLKSLFGNVLLIHKDLNFIKITYQTAFVKQSCFSSENEWRCVTFPMGEVHTFRRRDRNCRYFDYAINLNAIVDIIVGPSNKQIDNFNSVNNLISKLGIEINVSRSNIPLEI